MDPSQQPISLTASGSQLPPDIEQSRDEQVVGLVSKPYSRWYFELPSEMYPGIRHTLWCDETCRQQTAAWLALARDYAARWPNFCRWCGAGGLFFLCQEDDHDDAGAIGPITIQLCPACLGRPTGRRIGPLRSVSTLAHYHQIGVLVDQPQSAYSTTWHRTPIFCRPYCPRCLFILDRAAVIGDAADRPPQTPQNPPPVTDVTYATCVADVTCVTYDELIERIEWIVCPRCGWRVSDPDILGPLPPLPPYCSCLARASQQASTHQSSNQ
jgi:hypothetical protein